MSSSGLRQCRECLSEGLISGKVSDKLLKKNKRYDAVLGITNGGIIPARSIARELDMHHVSSIPVRSKKLYKEEMPTLFENKRYLVVDDIYDTGNTFSIVADEVKKFDCAFAFLVRRFRDNASSNGEVYVGETLNHLDWIVFPWEQKRITQ
jgi:uncharacterized protein